MVAPSRHQQHPCRNKPHEERLLITWVDGFEVKSELLNDKFVWKIFCKIAGTYIMLLALGFFFKANFDSHNNKKTFY